MGVIKPYTRQASVLWLGTRERGKGAVNTPSAALKLALYAAGGGLKRGGTNPPELIAAAHAGSFALSLANELGQAGYSPRQIDTTATVTMENVAAGWTLTQIHLDVVAAVPAGGGVRLCGRGAAGQGELPGLARAQRQYLDARPLDPAASRGGAQAPAELGWTRARPWSEEQSKANGRQ